MCLDDGEVTALLFFWSDRGSVQSTCVIMSMWVLEINYLSDDDDKSSKSEDY
jgi:hypothetical protein